VKERARERAGGIEEMREREGEKEGERKRERKAERDVELSRIVIFNFKRNDGCLGTF